MQKWKVCSFWVNLSVINYNVSNTHQKIYSLRNNQHFAHSARIDEQMYVYFFIKSSKIG